MTRNSCDGLALVSEFHRSFVHPIRDQITDLPRLAKVDLDAAPEKVAEQALTLAKAYNELTVRALRASLIAEEAGELIDGLEAKSSLEVADALGDLAYVTFGASLAIGAPMTAPLRSWTSPHGCHLEPTVASAEIVHVALRASAAVVAIHSGDGSKITAALDMLIIAIEKAANALGIDLVAVFTEIHASNMTKAWPDGLVRYREEGKVIKNMASYVPPNLEPILRLAAS